MTQEKQVKNGIKFLNENVDKDWYHKINLETLDLASPCDCILGQLYGHFLDGMDSLNLELEQIVDLGFDEWESSDNPVENLTSIWKKWIEKLCSTKLR